MTHTVTGDNSRCKRASHCECAWKWCVNHLRPLQSYMSYWHHVTHSKRLRTRSLPSVCRQMPQRHNLNVSSQEGSMQTPHVWHIPNRSDSLWFRNISETPEGVCSACACSIRIIGLIGCWGFPGCPRQWRMFLLRRKAAHFPLPPSLNPSAPHPALHLTRLGQQNTKAFVLFHLSGGTRNQTNKNPLVRGWMALCGPLCELHSTLHVACVIPSSLHKHRATDTSCYSPSQVPLSFAATTLLRSTLNKTGQCTLSRPPSQLCLNSKTWLYWSALASLLFQLSEQYIGENVCTGLSDVRSDLELPPGYKRRRRVQQQTFTEIWCSSNSLISLQTSTVFGIVRSCYYI